MKKPSFGILAFILALLTLPFSIGFLQGAVSMLFETGRGSLVTFAFKYGTVIPVLPIIGGASFVLAILSISKKERKIFWIATITLLLLALLSDAGLMIISFILLFSNGNPW